MKRRSTKVFLRSENLLGIYFDKLPYGEAEKMNSYLYDHEDYLGACQVSPHAVSLLEVDALDANLRFENRKVILFVSGFGFFHRKRDVILEELIKSLPFESWKYASRRSYYYDPDNLGTIITHTRFDDLRSS
jgi:hypothetical protein